MGELSVYSELLSIGNDSYNLLDSYSHSVNKDVGDRQIDLESSYVNHLAPYLDKLCRAKMMVTDRVEQLKQYIDALKRTNETANQRYAQSYNINDQLAQYKHHITIDEETSDSIENEILANIEKAQKAISAELFDKFINHIQRNETGKLIDLSKYINMNKMNNMMMMNNANVNRGMSMNMNRSSSRNMNPMNGNMNGNMNRNNNSPNNNIIRQRPLRSRHTRQSIATQTNLQRQQQQQQQLRNGHAMQQQSQVQQQQQQQQQVGSPNSQRKPPLISSQPQRSPNGAGVGSVGRGGRAPRSHFPQQQQ